MFEMYCGHKVAFSMQLRQRKPIKQFEILEKHRLHVKASEEKNVENLVTYALTYSRRKNTRNPTSFCSKLCTCNIHRPSTCERAKPFPWTLCPQLLVM